MVHGADLRSVRRKQDFTPNSLPASLQHGGESPGYPRERTSFFMETLLGQREKRFREPDGELWS